jgi:hypothetical protein
MDNILSIDVVSYRKAVPSKRTEIERLADSYPLTLKEIPSNEIS